MTEFTGESKIGFGALGFVSHVFISLSVIVVIISLLAAVFGIAPDFFAKVIVGAGVGVFAGVGLAFLNYFVS